MERFLRTKLLIGENKFKELTEKKVTVIGLGAVGSYVTESLARSGVFNFRLVDFDIINKSNINRQLFAVESTLGMPKVDAAEKRIYDINPEIKIEKIQEFAHEDTIEKILDNNPDLVIDAIDSVNPKAAVLAETSKRNIKIISSMGAALKTDPTKIRVDVIYNTKHCKLARFIRKYLRNRGIKQHIRCVYSTEQVNFDFCKLNKNSAEKNLMQRGREKKTLGSLSTITGIFGLTLATIALEELLNIKLIK